MPSALRNLNYQDYKGNPVQVREGFRFCFVGPRWPGDEPHILVSQNETKEGRRDRERSGVLLDTMAIYINDQPGAVVPGITCLDDLRRKVGRLAYELDLTIRLIKDLSVPSPTFVLVRR